MHALSPCIFPPGVEMSVGDGSQDLATDARGVERRRKGAHSITVTRRHTDRLTVPSSLNDRPLFLTTPLGCMQVQQLHRPRAHGGRISNCRGHGASPGAPTSTPVYGAH